MVSEGKVGLGLAICTIQVLEVKFMTMMRTFGCSKEIVTKERAIYKRLASNVERKG
jgi:hypothetical protein